ncbi:MAG: hypothetical protein NC207_08425 [Bacteroides sp.]|nr:hypothetical protein [Bacteroides sp.]
MKKKLFLWILIIPLFQLLIACSESDSPLLDSTVSNQSSPELAKAIEIATKNG